MISIIKEEIIKIYFLELPYNDINDINNNKNNIKIKLSIEDKKNIIKNKIIEYYNLDVNNLTELENNLINDNKTLECNLFLKYLSKDINNIIDEDIDLFNKDLNYFSIIKSDNKTYKLKTIIMIMKILEINKLEDITNELSNNYHKIIIDDNINILLQTIKKKFRITSSIDKFDIEYGYYDLFLLLKTILSQINDSLILYGNYKYFKVNNVNKKYYLYYINTELISLYKKYFK